MHGFFLFFISPFLISTSVFARETPETVRLTEVISEGKRLHADQRAVVILTEDELSRESGRTLGEVLRESAGVDFISGTGGNSNLLIRGSTGSQVLVLIDGVKANDPSASNRYFDWSRIDVTQIERVEILKGPQAVSYGSDAIGGVVLIRTKRGHSGLTAAAEAGGTKYARSRVSYGFSLDSQNTLSVYALGKGVFAGRSSAYGGVEGDNSKEATAGVELLSRISPDLRMKVSGDLRAAEEDIDQGPYDDDPNYIARNREIRGAVNLEGREWKSLVTHLDFRRAFSDFPDSAHTYASDTTYTGTNTRAEFQFHSVDTPTEWAIGLEGTRETLGIESILSPVNLAKTHGETVAVFMESSLPIDDSGKYRIDFGTRYSYFTSYSGQWGGKIGAVSKAVENLTIDAGVSTGFKAPSLYSLYEPTSGNDQLKPEESIQAELGAAYAFSRATTVEIRGFVNQVRNRFGFMPSSPYRSINIDRAELVGAEASLDHRFSSLLRISAATTLLSTRDKKTGEPLPDSPIWKENLKLIVTPTPMTSFTLSGIAKSSRGTSTANGRVPGFGRFDFSILHTLSEKFSLNARIENLLDRDYEEIRGYTSPRLTAYAGLEYRGF